MQSNLDAGSTFEKLFAALSAPPAAINIQGATLPSFDEIWLAARLSSLEATFFQVVTQMSFDTYICLRCFQKLLMRVQTQVLERNSAHFIFFRHS